MQGSRKKHNDQDDQGKDDDQNDAELTESGLERTISHQVIEVASKRERERENYQNAYLLGRMNLPHQSSLHEIIPKHTEKIKNPGKMNTKCPNLYTKDATL